jgi:hypothetical protein
MMGALCAIVMRDQALLARVRRWLPAVAATAACCVAVIVIGVRPLAAQLFYTQTLGFTALALVFGPLVMWAYLLSGSVFERPEKGPLGPVSPQASPAARA